MSRRAKLGRPFLVAALALIVSVAIAALAQGSGDGASTQSPSIPNGSSVDFCPTPEQTEAHLTLDGSDYKPTVACGRGGEARAPTPEQRADTARDPDEGLSSSARCRYHKQLLESAKPLPDSDGDPTTLEGELPNGARITVQVMTERPQLLRGETIRDEAKDYPC